MLAEGDRRHTRAKLVLSDLNLGPVEELVKEIVKDGGYALFFVCILPLDDD